MTRADMHAIDNSCGISTVGYFCEFRLIGRIDRENNNHDLRKATYEIFCRDRFIDPEQINAQEMGEVNHKPSLIVQLDLRTGSYTLQQLDSAMPAVNVIAVANHFTAEYLREDAEALASEYYENYAQNYDADVNENGLLVFASDVDFEVK